MKIKIQDKQEITLVSLEGNVMQEDVAIFCSRLDDLVQSGRIKIVLDLNSVNFLSSMCIAVIVETKNQLTDKKGDIKLAAVGYHVKNVFDLTRLSDKFEMYNSVEEAILGFK
jgi:anti-sigma B factor antagonist